MQEILATISNSAALALLGAGVLLVVLIAPVALRLAGLSGAQIVETLKLTLQFAVDAIKVFRHTDSTSLED